MNANGPILPFVMIAGLLDSINPCAIAVLLIFIALLFTLQKNRTTILMMGTAYIIAVYLTYLAIGLGSLKVINLFGVPHLVSKVAAYLIIVLGFWGLKEVFWPGKFRFLSISVNNRQRIAHFATQATLPTALVTGFLVGLFEFPCSGAIYLTTIALLNSKETYLTGLSYLLLYNFMFILPLIIILLAATNRMVIEKALSLDEANSSRMRLATSLIMISIGLVILIWFV